MTLALRPSFSVDLTRPSGEVIAQLARGLAAGPMHLRRARVPGGGRDAGPRRRDHLVLTAPRGQQRFWSPWLTIDVSPRGAGTQVHARFSPHPSVWTGFAFGYLTLGLVLAVSLVIAGAGMLVPGREQSWALVLAAGVALVLGGMWTASQLGQRLARTQMEELRGELERALAGCADGAA